MDVDTDLYYTPVDDWARMTGISRTVVYRKIADGTLTAVKLGSRTLIDVPKSLAAMRALPTVTSDASPRRRRATATTEQAA